MNSETHDAHQFAGQPGDEHDNRRQEGFTVPEPDGVTSGIPFEAQEPPGRSGEDERRGLAVGVGMAGDGSGNGLSTLGGMPLKRKLMLSFGLLTAVILVLGVIMLTTVRDISVHGIAEMTGHGALARLADELRSTVDQIHDKEKDFLLFEDATAPRQVERLSARVEELLGEIAAQVDEMGAQAGAFSVDQIADIRAAADDYIQRFDQLIENVNADRQALATQKTDLGEANDELGGSLDDALGRFDALVDGFWQRQAGQIDADALAEGRLLQRFARDLAVARAGLAAYVAGHDRSYPDVAGATFGEVLAQLDLLREQSIDPRLKRELSDARKALIAHDVMLRDNAAQRRAAEAREKALLEHIAAEKEALRKLGRDLTGRAELLASGAWEDVVADSAALAAMGSRAMWAVGITAAAGVVVGLLVLILIPRPIVAAIAQLVDGAQRIARGDLRTPIRVASRDELGLLGNTFERMRANLLELVRRIQRSAVQLSSSINEIQAAATQQAASSSQQASAVNQLSSSLNEMSQSAATLLSSAEKVGHSVDEIAGIVADGSTKSDQMMRSMDAIGISTRQTAERIKSLSDRMDDINEAVTTISGVADQTTLLSLNAAIEANKAGEMGKGFSVVAHEIRRLSDRSIDSAGNINAMVRDIQRATESSTLAMDKSSEEIRHGVTLVGQSAEALTAIKQSMDRIQEQMAMILESVRAQAESSRMVQSTSTEMLSSANMVSKAASQTRAVTHDLNNMASQLSAAVAAFNT